MNVLCRVVAGIAVALAPALVIAQAYPDKPIRMVLPSPAGSTPDLLARMVQADLSRLLGQQVVIDNRAGAGGLIGAEFVARASPDGYTLLWANAGPLTVLQHLQKLSFDPLKDFAPISLVSNGPMVLVSHPSVPVTTVRELIALAKKKPGQLDYASFGSGNVNHLAMEQFKSMTGVSITHVPYKGSPPARTALLGGHVHVLFTSLPPALSDSRSGRLRALGVTSVKRSLLLPEVPTISEAGVTGYESGSWFGLLAPAITPNAIVARLNEALVKVVRSPEIWSRFESEGSDPVGSSPGEFAAFIRAESEKNAKLVKISGAKLD
ncbi:MAG: Bug family tripartite tricarboxylate transporter substrate binding protein [Terriglobales bacterium]